MINEPLDVKRAVTLLARRKVILAAAAALGASIAIVLAILRPPLVTSQAWVLLPPPTRDGTGTIGTQVVIATSNPILARALPQLHPAMSIDELRGSIQVENRTATILIFTAKGRTAREAEDVANAVAQSYISYVSDPSTLPGGPVQPQTLQAATTASGGDSPTRVAVMGILGTSIGVVIAAFGVLASNRRDRRLWERDAIADSIGVPVLASIRVEHPSDANGWRQLLEAYQPSAVDAWRLRKVLQYLGLAEVHAGSRYGAGLTVTVISCSFDRRALALGPQLAAFAASRGIPTVLVIGPQQDVTATATLRAACAGAALDPASALRLVVTDQADAGPVTDAVFTVVVAVADGPSAQLATLIPTTASVLGVSAGTATAEQLANAAANAAACGHEVSGILVADPDPADTTTGRLPRLQGPAHRSQPRRTTGAAVEAGR